MYCHAEQGNEGLHLTGGGRGGWWRRAPNPRPPEVSPVTVGMNEPPCRKRRGLGPEEIKQLRYEEN